MAPLSAYEEARLQNIARNEAELARLHIPKPLKPPAKPVRRPRAKRPRSPVRRSSPRLAEPDEDYSPGESDSEPEPKPSAPAAIRAAATNNKQPEGLLMAERANLIDQRMSGRRRSVAEARGGEKRVPRARRSSWTVRCGNAQYAELPRLLLRATYQSFTAGLDRRTGAPKVAQPELYWPLVYVLTFFSSSAALTAVLLLCASPAGHLVSLFGAVTLAGVVLLPGYWKTVNRLGTVANMVKYSRLPDGTHCKLHGEPSGQLVVVIQGIGSDISTSDICGQGRALASAGFYVLELDLYGRGFSDAPRARYTVGLLVGQVRAALVSLELETRPTCLFGHSLGGAICVCYAARYPDSIHKLVLLAPAGFKGSPISATCRLAVTLLFPIVDMIAVTFGGFLLSFMFTWSQSKESSGREMTERILDASKNVFKSPAYFRAYLSTVRWFEFDQVPLSYKTVAAQGIPIHFLWGTADRVTPLPGCDERSARDAIQRVVPDATLKVYPFSGHCPMTENNKEFLADLVSSCQS